LVGEGRTFGVSGLNLVAVGLGDVNLVAGSRGDAGSLINRGGANFNPVRLGGGSALAIGNLYVDIDSADGGGSPGNLPLGVNGHSLMTEAVPQAVVFGVFGDNAIPIILVNGSTGDGDGADLRRVVSATHFQGELLYHVLPQSIREAHSNGVVTDLRHTRLPTQSARLGC
jgi:hypothetical protein